MYLSNGTLLKGGTYKIVRFISSGGFGCTYEAEHIMLQKRVAIKEFFMQDFCNRESDTAHIAVGTQSKAGLVEKMRNKFIDEARALTHLKHPGIVSVTDVFEENSTAYYVMDYIEGVSLRDKVKDTALSEGEALRYIRQVCDALRYVHSNNRLHLDIKPSNVMIDSSGNIILIDFGASKQYDEEGSQNTSTLHGYTPGYAPPEQMSNNMTHFNPATDIYGVGALLYKLLTSKTPPDVNSRISGDDLDPLPDSVSPFTQKAVEAALQLPIKKRPQSIDELLSILDPDYGHGPSTPSSGKSDNATKIATGATTIATTQPAKPRTTVPPTQPATQPTPPATQEEKKKKSLLLPIIIAAVVVIGAVAAFLLTRSDDSQQASDTEESVEEVVDSITDDNANDVIESVASKDETDETGAIEEVTTQNGPVGETATTNKATTNSSTRQKETSAVVTTGELSINYRPEGAEVWLDDKKVGVTPITLSDVELGSHKVRLVSNGYKAEVIDVEVKTGSNSLAGSMEKLQSTTDSKTKSSQSQQSSQPSSGKIAGHEYVDLGLSVKWATCNVGATSQTGNGNFYAWGETTIKSKYNDNNCATHNRDYSSIAGDAAYDAATANWGGSWRMPTQAEANELLNRCDWEWTTINGATGYKVISRTNGNWIFLPASGYREDTSTKGVGSSGNYWTSTPKSDDKKKAYSINFGNSTRQCKDRHRRRGFVVRPVSK